MDGTPEQMAYMRKVRDEIDHEITMLQMTYDTKTLATVMMARAARMLRVLHSTKMWRQADVEIFLLSTMQDVLDPLPADELPAVQMQTIGQPGKPN